MSRCITLTLPLLPLVAFAPCAQAQTPSTATVVIQDLDNPWGVAIQPETGHVFVSESGRGRVIRIVDGQPQDAIVGFSRSPLAAGSGDRIGPLGLHFLDRRMLAIGGGGRAAGDDRIYIAKVPDVGADPISVEAAMSFGPLGSANDGPAVGDFYGVAATAEAIVATGQGDDQAGWIVAIPIRKSDQLDQPAGYGKLTRLLSTGTSTQSPSPRAIVISPRGELIVGQMGPKYDVPDSRITFYRWGDGKRLLDLATGLYELTALAYGAPQSPTNKRRLYALDMAEKVPDAGGLYRLDAQRHEGVMAVAAHRIAVLSRPTAMTLASDGSLYVTLLGQATEAEGQRPGKLVRFAAGL